MAILLRKFPPAAVLKRKRHAYADNGLHFLLSPRQRQSRNSIDGTVPRSAKCRACGDVAVASSLHAAQRRSSVITEGLGHQQQEVSVQSSRL